MNEFTVTAQNMPDTTIIAEGLLSAVEQYARSRKTMAVGDVHSFTIDGERHAIDATITAEGSPRRDRVDMLFRIKSIPDDDLLRKRGKILDAVSGS